jgi:hypothetical protein
MMGVRNAMLSDLRESVRVWPQNASAAAVDADFESVRNDPSFHEIVRRGAATA